MTISAPTPSPGNAPEDAPGIALTEAYAAFLELLRSRRSCRRYDPSRPVPRALIHACIAAAQPAPSACNRQPWRFVVADDPEVVAAIRAKGRKLGVPHPWWDDVPVFVALCAKLDFVTHRLAPAVSGIPYYLLDLGIAGEHVVLAAESLGLGTCWIGWFRSGPLRRILRLPRGIRVVSLLTLGWPAPGWEPAPPSRLEVDDLLHWNAW